MVCRSLDRALFFFQTRCGIRSMQEINYALMVVLVATVFIGTMWWASKLSASEQKTLIFLSALNKSAYVFAIKKCMIYWKHGIGQWLFLGNTIKTRMWLWSIIYRQWWKLFRTGSIITSSINRSIVFSNVYLPFQYRFYHIRQYFNRICLICFHIRHNSIRSMQEINYALMVVLVATVFIKDENFSNKKVHDILEAWYWAYKHVFYYSLIEQSSPLLSSLFPVEQCDEPLNYPHLNRKRWFSYPLEDRYTFLKGEVKQRIFDLLQ